MENLKVVHSSDAIGSLTDFTNMFNYWSACFKLGTDFEFERKPTVDYFYSQNEFTAMALLYGKRLDGEYINQKLLGNLARISFDNVVPFDELSRGFDEYLDDIREYKGRAKHEVNSIGGVIGARTSDFEYKVILDFDGKVRFSYQLRNDVAVKFRDMLKTSPFEVVVSQLYQEFVLGLNPDGTQAGVFKDNTPIRRVKKTEAEKMANRLARSLITYWTQEGEDITESVLPLVKTYVEAYKFENEAKQLPGFEGTDNDRVTIGSTRKRKKAKLNVVPTIAEQAELV